MPSKSAKQHRLMAMVANDPKAAKRLGIKQSIGEEFMKADKGRKFGTGGDVSHTIGGQGMINKQRTRFGSILGNEKNAPNENLNRYIGKKEGGKVKHDDLQEDKKLIKRAFKMHDDQEHKGGKGTNLSKLKKGGEAMKKMCGGGKTKKMAMGGMDDEIDRSKRRTKPAPAPRPGMPEPDDVMKKGGKVKKMASGGVVDKEPRSAAKGIHSIQKKARRGAEQIAMKKGGKC